MYRTPEIPADSGWSPELIENLMGSLRAMRSRGLSEKAQALFFRSALRSDAICQRLAAYKSASPAEKDAILGELTKFVQEHFPPKEEASVDDPVFSADEPKKDFKGWRMPPPGVRKPETQSGIKVFPADRIADSGNMIDVLRMFCWGIIIFGVPTAIGAGWAVTSEYSERMEAVKAETESTVQACLHQDYSGPCMASCMPFTYRNDLPCSCYGHLMVKDVPVRCVQK